MNLQKSKRQRYFIAVRRWGVIDEEYTEQEAEEMRCHKADWEAAPAIKILADDFFKLSDKQRANNWAYKAIQNHLDAPIRKDTK